ncbi:cytoplasmic dynein 1 light intermediate chain 2-like [Eurytemora carolleeae]|uniref:cytoplasmic dynein 1 light intermediate chain 2-like n=1 Tax=Eurytemora carolleeae TaxID=1294199 RepID=UPI000C7588CC|nr:cytoplasmic dynein 1 light intermediate chain 2-like [Eurytemora carolleeae]|eukprot:XP_023346496.1 cytoplasmic dynein 1 light intermediate chain 2-like [Eurytemora affinis]
MSEEEENLWSSLLQEVQCNSKKGLPSSKNILVLGDNLSGKTTLVAKLQGIEEPKKGTGLEYGYMEIRDDSFEQLTHLGVHTLDGDPKHINLLKYALRWRQYSEFVDFFDFSPSSDLTESMYRKDIGDRYLINIYVFRKFCLRLGASLFYVSVKENKNCDLLYKYLTHRIFHFSFNTPALVMERDALFIPAGWDSQSKISILYENIRTFYPDQPYSDVVKSPKLLKKYEAKVEIVAESEQDFLARIFQYLGDSSETAEGVLKTPERRVFGSPGVYGVAKRVPIQNTSDGAISNFFHALLNKKSGAASIQESEMYEKAYNRSESCTSQEDKLGTVDGMTGENVDGMSIEGMTELPVENANQQENLTELPVT